MDVFQIPAASSVPRERHAEIPALKSRITARRVTGVPVTNSLNHGESGMREL